MSLSKLVLLNASALFIAGCAHQPTVLPTPRLVYTCPRIQNYSSETLTEADKEMMAYGEKTPTLSRFISDYLSLRDAAKVCQQQSAQALVTTQVKK